MKPCINGPKPKESAIESNLDLQVHNLGGYTRKFMFMGARGANDRIVFYKGAHFVELKRPGGILSKRQQIEFDKMAQQQVMVWVIASIEEVDKFIKYLQTL